MENETNKLTPLRHSAEHILTQAMEKLYPNILKAMGPATENGFYFDFDLSERISEEDFPKIEKEMQKIIDLNLPISRQEVTSEKAKKLFKNNPYKQEWIKEAEERKEKLSVYWTGRPDSEKSSDSKSPVDKEDSFVDLCSGPHLNSTGEVKAFKLLSVAGAYWHGDEKNKMLTRIYGTAYPTQKELDEFILQQEEAKKRNHKKLGVKLGLWTFSDLVGSGLPLFTPKGALIRRLINEFVENLQSAQGIAQVWTPQIAKADLFKISGHYEKYKENMFQVKSNYSEEEFFLKPMNCPQHTQIYASQQRSYKDLPLRFADFAMLYRDEKPGELSGLTRTRSFSQDDCHIFCRPDQVEEEMHKALDMTQQIMKTYGFSYKYRFSVSDPKHPEKYLGDKQTWDKAERLCKKILEEEKIEYFVGVGEAAFYAPKLDLIAIDSLGREWQLSTLQIDFFMPERFNLTYIDATGKEKCPVMLHRAISGSPERLLAILIEHYDGAFPVWLSPVQVQIIPISENHVEYAGKILEEFSRADIRANIDSRNETMQAKIRDAQIQKIPYMAIVGDKEVSCKNITVRLRDKSNLNGIKLNEFISRVAKRIKDKNLEL